MDAIVEVNRQGTVIWEWWFFNHVVQDIILLKHQLMVLLKILPENVI